MKVSRNELCTALKRAFEGAGYDIGDYEDAGEFITWSQMCGLNAFSQIDLPPEGPKGSATPRLVYEGNHSAVIDAGGADVCQYGSLASHLGLSMAKKQGLVTVQLENCRNPGSILRSLSLVAQQGVYITAYWYDQSGAHCASFEQGSEFPNYWRLTPKPSANFDELSTITLLFTINASLLADAVTRPTDRAYIQRLELTMSQLAANYDNALEYGISIDDVKWQAVNAAAWPILVSATEQSRQGAGPGQ